jgi:hypothetical protein
MPSTPETPKPNTATASEAHVKTFVERVRSPTTGALPARTARRAVCGSRAIGPMRKTALTTCRTARTVPMP